MILLGAIKGQDLVVQGTAIYLYQLQNQRDRTEASNSGNAPSSLSYQKLEGFTVGATVDSACTSR